MTRRWYVAPIMLATATLAGCGGGTATIVESAQPTSITLNNAPATEAFVGESYRFGPQATVLASDGPVSYSIQGQPT
jgi:hypothetical protein